MSDTPRTDDQIGYAGSTMSAIRIEFARQLERELNAANQRIKQLEDNRTVAAANSLANMLAYKDAIAKIKRLEEAAQRVDDAAHSIQDWSGTVLGDALDELNKAKESKP